MYVQSLHDRTGMAPTELEASAEQKLLGYDRGHNK